MATPPWQRPRRSDRTLVVRGVGEKRSLRDWLVLGGIPGLVLVACAVVLVLWLRAAGEVQMVARDPQDAQTVAGQPGVEAGGQLGAVPSQPTPGVSEALPGGTVPAAPAEAGGAPAAAPEALSGSAQDWPCFRGPGYNAVSSVTGLARSWPASGPAKLWSVSLGEGHAGAAVYGNRVYVLDYDQGARADNLRCFDLGSGKQLWQRSYPCYLKNNHGLSRTVPAVNGKYVVSLGPLGMLMCCEAASGKLVWQKDLVKEYGTKIPEWYAGECPLIENNRAIVAPGGKAIMIAVDLPSGKVAWTAPNPKGWQMTHSSITPVSFAGKRVFVYPATGGVVGVNAADGSYLWDTAEWTVNTANVPAPVSVGDGRVFLCGGYNSGAMMIKLSAGATGVSKVFRLPASTFQSHQHTPILYQGHLYGVKAPNGELVCLDLNGKVVWSSGTARFGLGPYTLADGMLYVLSDRGELTLVEASPSGYKQLAKAKVLSGRDAWAPMAIVDGKLLCRDSTTMVCLSLR